MGGAISSMVPDNLWHGVNDAFRQGAVVRRKGQQEQPAEAGERVDVSCYCWLLLLLIGAAFCLVAIAGASGKFAGVFLAAAWASVGGATARGRIRTAAFITHLGRKATGAVFVE